MKSINDRLIKVMGLPADTAPKVFSAKQKQCLCSATSDGEFATCFGGANGQGGEKIAGGGEGKAGKNRGGR